jgi:pimeloyl-ACP methyl ester carboxylesterase
MKLFFRHFGEGQPLIILHGLFGQSDNWVTVGKKLAEQYSVYIPDQRNHGQSPHATVHTYPALADDLLEFIEEQELENIILVGHSMGGKAAMSFALEHPELIEKLVIVDISPRKYPERNIHTQVITQMLSIDLGSTTSRSEVERILEQQISDQRIRYFILKNLYYKIPGKLGWRLNLEAINHNLDHLFDGISAEEPFKHPTLFIKGGNSDYILEQDIPAIEKLFPLASIKTISGATHWVHADAPEELLALIIDFLRHKIEDPA